MDISKIIEVYEPHWQKNNELTNESERIRIHYKPLTVGQTKEFAKVNEDDDKESNLIADKLLSDSITEIENLSFNGSFVTNGKEFTEAGWIPLELWKEVLRTVSGKLTQGVSGN